MPQVLPNSGDMLAIVARSASGRLAESVTEEFDELVDDSGLAQHLGDRQHQVRGRGARGERAGQAKSDDLRNEHRDWLPEHGRFRFDATDAPAEHTEAVDHRRMRIGSDQRVRICARVPFDRDPRRRRAPDVRC